jgi:hypothetical protein
MYKLNKDFNGNNCSINQINNDGFKLSIPFDPANMDFVEYNKWLALGNQPLPPDEPTLP